MSAGHNDAKLLYSISNIAAFHIQNGNETSLTPNGPQTLSLLMVPTHSPFADLSTSEPNNPVEDDFYLHLHLPPDLDMSLPATTQIFHQPPRSYLIPRWDLGPESHAFTRIEFPKVGSGPGRVSQDDIDTFETILAQCTAFLERAKPPLMHKSASAYNPADYAPGEGYVGIGSEKPHGQIVLIDEENGSVVGELGEGYDVTPSKDVKPGSKSMSVLFLLCSIDISLNSLRPGRDHAASRRTRQPNSSRQCIRRISTHGPPPCLRKLNHCTECSRSISSDCDWQQLLGHTN